MSNELNPEAFSLEFLMSVPPDGLTDRDLAAIVQYHRNVRADRADAATKSRKREAASTETPTGIRKLISSRKPAVKLSRRGL